MTFAQLEQSSRSGAPVSFYRLAWGNTVWRYTNSDRDYILDGETYVPAAITEGKTKAGGRDVPEIKIEVPTRLPVVDLFRGTPPSTRVVLTVRSLQPADGEAKYRWIEPVTNVQPVDNAKSVIVSRINGLRRAGLRLTYGVGCKFPLYGPGCELDKTPWGVARTIVAVDGNSIQLDASSPSPGYFNGGMMEWDADGLGTLDARTIERETASDTYTLFGRGDRLEAGMTVTCYPGCPRSSAGCISFDNLVNYPGFDFMLGESPFDGKALV